MSRVTPSAAAPRVCKRCPAPVFRQAQVCNACRQKEGLCRECDEPHGGSPTTKLCPPCRAKSRTKKRKNPVWTPADDVKIRAAYATHNSHEVIPHLMTVFPKHKRWSITRRAQAIGAATVRTKEPRWSEAEDAILQEHAWMSAERIGIKLREGGFSRTVTSIHIRKRRYRLRDKIDGMTLNALAELLDVDIHKAITWQKKGWLKAERYGTSGDNHDHWHVTTEAIRSFFFEHYEQIDLTKLERAGSKVWFLELITFGRMGPNDPTPQGNTGSGGAPTVPTSPAAAGGEVVRRVPLYGERVTLSALADICGKSEVDLLHRIDGLGMSVHEAAFGEDGASAGQEAGPMSPLTRGLLEQLRALMKKHRAKPAHLAEWTGLPAGLVEAILSGTTLLISPALCKIVEKLAGEIRVTIDSKQPSYA